VRIARNHADLGAFLFDFTLSGYGFPQIKLVICFVFISSGLHQGVVSFFSTLHFSERDGHLHPPMSRVLKLFLTF
jgi:hypothetical protein